MKKFVILLLTAILALGFASCSENKDNSNDKTSESSKSSTQSTTIPPQRVPHIAQSIESGQFESFEEYSDEDKKKIQKAVEEDGYTLEFNEDGSGTLSNEEGSWFVGKGWVENEYTKGLPAIDFGKVTMSAEDKDEKGEFYMFLVRSVSAQEAASYVEELKKIGYTANGDAISLVSEGMVIFEGINAQEKQISLALSPHGFTLKIYK